jgi:hypothetical protein
MNWYEIKSEGAITGWSSHDHPVERQTDFGLYVLLCVVYVKVDHSGFCVRGLERQRQIAVPAEVKAAAAAEWCRRWPSYDGTKQWARQAHIAACAAMGTFPAGAHGSPYARDHR